ncbi:hypothetical protein L6164_031787 [Bauhinia variegata]|uniref:Uncharacterized protein n=1 Tax=Bauhinia variegata TaxID=167791 RepID=A0ACB9KLQ4_BAUVA|nr:hypothetical protein L6164_031787 [Bauhinia variegata]
MASYHLLENHESFDSLLCVQQLMKNPLASIPQRYIRLDDQDPPITQNETLSPEIPTIDMKQLVSGEAMELELEKLHLACKDWGFFQLVNHGVSALVLEKLKDELQEFFKLPLEEKFKYKIRPGDVEGYGALILSEDQKLDWGDRFYMVTNPLHTRKPHLFPELPSSLRTILGSYILELQNLAMILLGSLAKVMKIDKKEIQDTFENGMQTMRITNYPPCPQPELVMGITAHSDASGITILNQLNEVNGLQLKKDGLWIPVNFISDALVVNIGDILEIMSNGIYKSVEHRAVVNSEKERLSVALFFNPKFESEVGPSISLINPQNPPLFKRIGMENYVKQFFSRKLDGKSNIEFMKIRS